MADDRVLTLHELLVKQFGVKSRGKVSTVEVGTDLPATKIVGNNPNRVGLTIVNYSSTIKYVSFEQSMGLTQGVYLAPEGGSISLNWQYDFDIVGWGWYGVSAGAAGSVNIIEVIMLQ